MAPSKFLVFLLIAGVVSASWPGSAEAGSSASPVLAVNTKDGFALKGYDPSHISLSGSRLKASTSIPIDGRA
jgi:hypothetical protein